MPRAMPAVNLIGLHFEGDIMATESLAPQILAEVKAARQEIAALKAEVAALRAELAKRGSAEDEDDM